MSYIVYLNEFNRWLESNELSNTAQLLYFKMLDVFNRAGWPESVQLSPLKVMVMARLRSASAASAARDALRAAGFLTFIDEDGGEAGRYFLTNPWGNPAPEIAPESEPEKDSDREDGTEAAPENETEIDRENRTEFSTKNCTEINTENDTENDSVSESTNDKHNKDKKKTKTKTKTKNNSPLAVARGEYARTEKSEKAEGNQAYWYRPRTLTSPELTCCMVPSEYCTIRAPSVCTSGVFP